MQLTKRRITSFQNKLFVWWESHKRDLPWRRTRDPYRILVSEVMLQQTQVSRVLPKYEEFLYYFPDVYALARASSAKVLRVWKGMGYNRRALYLKRTAEAVVRDFHGDFPQDETELTQLPGLGIYTARALLVFAYEHDVAMIDTNIRQIITHFFFQDKPQKEKVIQELADQLLPKGKSWEWHQTLMDFGALELKRRKKMKRDVRIYAHPFRESNRFYRGRIVDHLRERSSAETVLMKILEKKYGKQASFFPPIIRGLIKDGLIVRSGARLHLPE